MKSVFHAAISVSDLDRSVAFYRDILGLQLVIGPTEVFEGEELSKGVGVPGAVLRQAILSAEEGMVELIEYIRPERAEESPPPQNFLGAIHIAFRVDDADERMKALQKKGVDFLTPLNIVEKGPLKGWKWVYFKDPDGIILELVELDQDPF
jgi:catechol 2,3-dioxygenase-like lactoylglutathione lyase family enzyme